MFVNVLLMRQCLMLLMCQCLSVILLMCQCLSMMLLMRQCLLVILLMCVSVCR